MQIIKSAAMATTYPIATLSALLGEMRPTQVSNRGYTSDISTQTATPQVIAISRLI